MKNKFIEECIILLKKDENVKSIINPLIEPIITNLLKELNPYIYLSLVFVFISFLTIMKSSSLHCIQIYLIK